MSSSDIGTILSTSSKGLRAGRTETDFYAIASGKGGVGKTWLAVTLAQALARSEKKVLLFDGDLGLANVDIHLGLMTEAHLGHVVSGEKTLNQAVTHYEAGGFDVIAGDSGSGVLSTLPPGRLQILLEDLQIIGRNYDHVLFDLSSGISRTNRAFTRMADTILIMVADEPTSIADAYALIKLTVQENPNADIRIVVNASNSSREGERTYQTLLKATQGFLKYGPALLGVIRRDTRVREAIRNQVPLLIHSPNSEAAMDVETLAQRLLFPTQA